jgi:hypothetical protein
MKKFIFVWAGNHRKNLYLKNLEKIPYQQLLYLKHKLESNNLLMLIKIDTELF